MLKFMRVLRPNVEVTGAARLYCAASVLTAGLGIFWPYNLGEF